ncbi:glycosyltransferase [Mucilaginibacter sp. UYCu711]|uniref:glycosyltransferase n=1 Tax=Mucilaginibacter sp. UYCu711 TaxID=3156339 RepID=UPI003D2306F5
MISIIIPTFNRSALLKNTLASIVKQNYVANDFEVIVVDNGSTDDTKNLCSDYSSHIKNFTYCYDNMPGLLTGRHKGAKVAKGEILAFIDDDVELSTYWLTGINESFNNTEVSFLTGPCLPKYESPPPEWLNYFWDDTPYGGKMCTWLSLLDLGNKSITVHPNYVWGLNFCIRKNVMLQLGGFHPDCIPDNLQQYQGDGETGLTIKAAQREMTAQYNPKVMLYHIVPAHRLTLAYFEKRAFYQGVCNSFTEIRIKNFTTEHTQPAKSSYTIPRRIYRGIKRRLFIAKRNNEPGEAFKIKVILDAAEKKGYQFHQNAFNTDDAVKEWVLKKNFFKYNLPNR